MYVFKLYGGVKTVSHFSINALNMHRQRVNETALQASYIDGLGQIRILNTCQFIND
jgi:hypothetical protein